VTGWNAKSKENGKKKKANPLRAKLLKGKSESKTALPTELEIPQNQLELGTYGSRIKNSV